MAYEIVSVPNLSVGDIIVSDGIKVKLTSGTPGRPQNNCGCNAPDHMVRAFTGPILNWDEVAGLLRGIVSPDDRTWTVQGNHLATVARITED